MRKIFEQLQAALRQFLKQRDYLLLLVPCEDTDVALLLKALRDLDRELGSDMFLLFAEGFRSPGQYLEVIAQSLQEEHRLTNSSAGPDTPESPRRPAVSGWKAPPGGPPRSWPGLCTFTRGPSTWTTLSVGHGPGKN